VTVTALFKKKKSQLTVGAHITLENLLLQPREAFGCRVKVKLEDDDGDQIAITDDQELTDALMGEERSRCRRSRTSSGAANTGLKKGSASVAVAQDLVAGLRRRPTPTSSPSLPSATPCSTSCSTPTS
jgi:hypothetical protein